MLGKCEKKEGFFSYYYMRKKKVFLVRRGKTSSMNISVEAGKFLSYRGKDVGKTAFVSWHFLRNRGRKKFAFPNLRKIASKIFYQVFTYGSDTTLRISW